MEHAEYCYLVHRAHELLRFHERAAAEGEEFHTIDSFTPLKCGLLATAVIRPITPGETNVIILRLRYPEDTEDFRKRVHEAQGKFFGDGYVVVPGVVALGGLFESLAYSSKVPEALKPPRA